MKYAIAAGLHVCMRSGRHDYGDEAQTRRELATILDVPRPMPPPKQPPVFETMTVLAAAEAGGGDDAQQRASRWRPASAAAS